MPIIGIPSSGGMKPTTPTIGAASDGGTGTTASVAFTPSTYIGKGTITYTATSSPGGFTGTGSSSPITVSGLTTGTAYTFTVYGTTNYGVVSGTSAASNSVTPASPGAFESIATLNLNGTNTGSFTSIPTTYKHLQIRGVARSNQAALYDTLSITFNSDTSAIYNKVTFAAWDNAFSNNNVNASANLSVPGWIPAANTSSPDCAIFIMDIYDYASTSKYRSGNVMYGVNNKATTNNRTNFIAFTYASTSSAITSITLAANSGNFITSSFALYGIKG